MKNHKNRMKKLNNSGLTLIEILIAMTLLTICIVPMLRGFVQVNRYGEKGRNLQQSTTVAQTAMENCKAYNIADIHTKMTTNAFMDAAAPYMAGAQYHSDGVGSYFIDNMTIDGRKVGMSIKLSPITATKQDITKYENCNPRLDGIFVASTTLYNDGTNDYDFYTMETTIFDEQLDAIGDIIEQEVLDATTQVVTLSIAELRENLFDVNSGSVNLGAVEFRRDITITAQTDASTGVDTAKVEYTYQMQGVRDYEYTMMDGTVVVVDNNLFSDTESIDSIIYTNSNSKDQGGKLERIYFYYYPAYNSGLFTENPCVIDKIVINTENFKATGGAPKDLDVYLIKQKLPATSNLLIELAEGDTYYKNYVEIKAGVNGTEHGTVNLYHNYNTNIGNGSTLTWPETGESTAAPSGSGVDKGGLVVNEQKELMYTIEVKMYSNPIMDAISPMQMTGEEILTLDGTKINW